MGKLRYQLTERVRKLVRARRAELGKRQDEFAASIDISRRVIEDIERGRRGTGPVILASSSVESLAEGLGVDLAKFIRLFKEVGTLQKPNPRRTPRAHRNRPEPGPSPPPAPDRDEGRAAFEGDETGSAGLGPSAHQLHRRVVNIGLVLNGDVQYSHEICRGFQDALEHSLRTSRFCPRIEQTSVSPESTRSKKNATHLYELLARFAAGRPDYLVTIGTQPTVTTMPLARSLSVPFIFIGVTDPVAAGVVPSLRADPARGEVAGVAYGLSTELRMRFLSSAFLTKRIGFIWSSAYSQDQVVKDEIERLCAAGAFDPEQFVLIHTKRTQLTARQERSADVFFGHFHLNANFAEFARSTSKPLVGVNTGDVRRDAVASTGHDDRELGSAAAKQILIRHLMRGVALSDMDIICPDTARFAVNLPALKARRISISPTAYNMASEVIE